ncbi:MAG: adenylyl-sulfate kinase [Candidatus Zixiibacteriota bacterium]
MSKSNTVFQDEISNSGINSVIENNIFHSESQITRREREIKNGHKSCIIWLTGLSGSGKSTIATELERELFERHCQVAVLDGDNIRRGINADLGFSAEDREENIRRIGEVSKLFMTAGVITISAFISPYLTDRKRARDIVGESDFIEVYLDCPLEICEQRDVKGLYKKARAGLIKNFTGIDDPYEKPNKPELSIHTDWLTIKESVNMILNYLDEGEYLCRK